MAAFNKFNQFVQDMATKKHDLSADVMKVALTNTAPVATNAIFTDITDLTAAAGYTAGGTAATITSATQTSGVLKLILVNVVFTATGAMGPFRYAVLYNSTQATPLHPLIGYYDYGSAVTLANTETFTVAFDATNGVLTVT